MKLTAKAGFYFDNRVTVEKWSEKRGTKETLEFKNLVLNVGIQNFSDRLLADGGAGSYQYRQFIPRYLYLGTSSVDPSPEQAGLLAIAPSLPGNLASSEFADFGDATSSPRWNGIRQTFNYGEGAAEGTWLELGLAYGSTYTHPYNRALFKDENGDPVAVTVLSDEFLRVHVEIRTLYPNCSGRGKFKLINLTEGTEEDRFYSFDFYGTGNTGGLSGQWFGSYSPYRDYHGFRAPNIHWNGRNNTVGFGNITTNESEKKISWSLFQQVGVETVHIEATRGGTPGIASYRRCWGFVFDEPVVKPFDYQLQLSGWIQWILWLEPEDSGAVTAGADTTMSDNTKAWGVDDLAGKWLHLVGEGHSEDPPNCAGPARGQVREIISNTEDTITISEPWNIVPGVGDFYEIRAAQ